MPAQSEPGAYLHIGLGALSPATPAALSRWAGLVVERGPRSRAARPDVRATDVQAARPGHQRPGRQSGDFGPAALWRDHRPGGEGQPRRRAFSQ